MRDTRAFHAEPLADNSPFVLATGAARHLVRVLRLRAGARFTVFDGSGREWPAELLDENGDARAGVGAVVNRESPLPVTLVLGVSRGERMDIAVQKAVELGAFDIRPVLAERSVVQLDVKRAARRVAHWQGIAVAACEQCGRNVVPRVHELLPLADWLAANELPALVLDPMATATLADVGAPPGAPVALLVGPEGGFSDEELAVARATGCIAIRLGPRVLRAETAGIAMLAALQALYGDYR